MKLSRISDVLNGKLLGHDADVHSFSIDTRTLQPGDLYFAIRGESLDGHAFVANAVEKGASCLVVDREISTSAPCIIVSNTTQALQKLAAYWRQQSSAKAIAVTGSCGKTTTRAFLKSVFSEAGSVHASIGSFNNHIGVPLTLLGLKPSHDYLIAELGTNHRGEIPALTPLVKPDVSIITNVAPAHLEGFGSVENIAIEKAAIYSGLSDTGVAIVNADDAFSEEWSDLNRQRKVITFGVTSPADISAKNITMDTSGVATFVLVLPSVEKSVTLAMMGKHNVMNALAAAAAGYALGLSIDQIAAGLEKATTEKRRLVEIKLPIGAVLIDDSYNANPLSTEAAIHLLVSRPGQSVFVFGDMGELGTDAVKLHTDIGRTAKECGVDTLYACGNLTKNTVDSFGDRGFYFSDKQALIEKLRENLTKEQVILVKGSNFMKMNEIVEGLK